MSIKSIIPWLGNDESGRFGSESLRFAFEKVTAFATDFLGYGSLDWNNLIDELGLTENYLHKDPFLTSQIDVMVAGEPERNLSNSYELGEFRPMPVPVPVDL